MTSTTTTWTTTTWQGTGYTKIYGSTATQFTTQYAQTVQETVTTLATSVVYLTEAALTGSWHFRLLMAGMALMVVLMGLAVLVAVFIHTTPRKKVGGGAERGQK